MGEVLQTTNELPAEFRSMLKYSEKIFFHPLVTPRGMTWYDLNALTPEQQKLLIDLKIDIIRENNQYLAAHPEIHALIALFVRDVLKNKPPNNTIYSYAAKFFVRPQDILETEINEYLEEMGEPKKREGDSAVNVRAKKFPISKMESSIASTASLYQQRPELFTYVSYTDIQSSRKSQLGEGEWSSVESMVWTERSASKEPLKVTSSLLEPESSPSDLGLKYENVDAVNEDDMLRLLFKSQVVLTEKKKSRMRQSTEDIIRYLMTQQQTGEAFDA